MSKEKQQLSKPTLPLNDESTQHEFVHQSSFNNEPNVRRKFHPDAFNYIVAYLEIGYLFCFIPFGCKFNRETGHYQIVEFLPQKLLAIILITWQTAYALIWYSCLGVKHNYSDDPIKLFRKSQAVIEILYVILFAHSVLSKKNNFKDFLKLAQEHYSHEESATGHKKNFVKFAIFFIYIFAGTVYIWISVVTAPVNNTKQLFSTLSSNETSSWLTFLVDIHEASVPSLLFSFWRAIGESMCVPLFGFGWYLKQLCEDLCRTIKNVEKSYPEILEQYATIIKINDSFNSIAGYMTFSFVIGSVPYVAEGIMCFSLADPGIILKFIYAGNGFLVSMLGSAEANRKANQLKHALLDRQILNPDKIADSISMQMLISEFSSPEIGLKGVTFFNVTYGFVGVMLSQCLVYALLIVQLYSINDA